MSWSDLVFSGALVDRAAHRRTDEAWLADAWQRARVLVLSPTGHVLVAGRSKLVLLSAAGAPEGERVFLGVDDDGPYFAVVAELPEQPGAEAMTLRQIGAELDAYDAALLAEAVGVANWRATYRFSPATGAPLVSHASGWELVAADGSGTVWPRTNPAVIVLISDGVAGDEGRCLLTRQSTWPAGRYSCLAGFVEPGESAEAAVHRETMEEVGVEVRDAAYVASQPWPVPASLMLGFTALADPAQPLQVDTSELEDARWFTRGQLRGKGPGPSPLAPTPVSISYALITAWRDELSASE